MGHTGLPRHATHSAFTQACDGGYARACTRAGHMYVNAMGVAKDYAVADRFFQRACDGGEFDACTRLGVAYAGAKGVPEDQEKAVALFRRSCDGNEMPGCFSLGLAYLTGEGIPRDRALGKRYIDMACKAGMEQACEALREPALGLSDTATSAPVSDDGCPPGTQLTRGAASSDQMSGAEWCQLADGTRHGPYWEFWSPGVKGVVGQYVDGKRSGRWVTYWPSGEILGDGSYRDDRAIGIWVMYSLHGIFGFATCFDEGRKVWEVNDRQVANEKEARAKPCP